MIVVKFGGTSVGDADAIRRVCEIVRARLDRKPLVVVSALAGTTNDLLAIAELSSGGNLISALSRIEELRSRHLATARELLGDGNGESRELQEELSAMFDELAMLAEALSVLGHLTPRSLDSIAAIGERASAPMVAAAMRKCGLKAQVVDARKVMITDENFTRATPLPDEIADAARRNIAPLIRKATVPVVGGYVGATRAGITTTLGRGGSDYSAALFGAAMQAEAIEIWTDVDGMLTADPRVVSGSLLISQIRFDEASELAYFGAKVLHPSTIVPAVQKGIPVLIYNSRKPEGSGTRITFDAPRRAVSAIAGKKGIAVVRVRSPQMLLAHGFMRHVFEIFERHRISVDVVATSEISLSVTIDESAALDALLLDLMKLGDVSIERNRGIIALVGGGLSDGSAAMARALTALNGCRVHMLSLSSTGINLTMIVDSEEVGSAMQRLHHAFFGAGGEGGGTAGAQGRAMANRRLAIVGYGKMGHAVEDLARQGGWEVVCTLDQGWENRSSDVSLLETASVAVEFSEPRAAVTNIRAIVAARCPVVVGTTGWQDELESIRAFVYTSDGSLLWSPNFSVGAQMLLRLAGVSGSLVKQAGIFDAHILETHHAAKKDVPSGTAVAIARAAEETLDRKVPTTSVRTGHEPGTHELIYDAPFEQIRITHHVRDRRVFAAGALVAAEWLLKRVESGSGKGVFTMNDVLQSSSSGGGGG